jgi:predicted Zn-dependent protease
MVAPISASTNVRCLIAISVMTCWQVSVAFAQDPTDALQNMFERLGQQSEVFVPGIFSELTPVQMTELEEIPISKREETQFGSQVLKDYESLVRSQNKTLTRKGKDVRYLTLLVNDLRPNMKHAERYQKFDIAIVDDDIIDAYSIPGGHLLFTRGLIDDVQSEAELVGVICHELSHLDRGHQLLPLKQSKRTNTAVDFRSSMQWLATSAKPFRPEFESQADADAVKWMLASGYDARELARLLIRWQERQDQTASWTKMVPSFARSHPGSARRATVILDSVDQAQDKHDALIVGKENLAKRKPHSSGKLAKD